MGLNNTHSNQRIQIIEDFTSYENGDTPHNLTIADNLTAHIELTKNTNRQTSKVDMNLSQSEIENSFDEGEGQVGAINATGSQKQQQTVSKINTIET